MFSRKMFLKFLFALVVFNLLPGVVVSEPDAVSKVSSYSGKKIDAFILEVLNKGYSVRVPAPVATLLSISQDSPNQEVYIPSGQAVDGLTHEFYVTVKRSSDTDALMPMALVLLSSREWDRNSEGYWYRASLTGKIEKVVVIQGKLNEKGKAIKGSGTVVEKDIDSADIKQRFQHEMDLWLKRAYIRKEWLSADFEKGELKLPKVPHEKPTTEN